MKSEILKKIFISFISWTMILMPVHAQSENANSSAVENPAAEMPSNNSNSNGQDRSNANWCIESSKDKVSECNSQGKDYNCHLEKCASKEDNSSYNAEYNNCTNDSCREDLKTIENDMATYQASRDQARGAVGSGSADTLNTASTAVSVAGTAVGLAVNAATVGVAMSNAVLSQGAANAAASAIGHTATASTTTASTAASGSLSLGEIFSGMAISTMMGIAVLVMALLNKDKQESQYDQLFNQAQMMFTKAMQSGEHGFNIEGQLVALEYEIQALKLIKQAAEEKAGNHGKMATMYTIVSVVAAIEVVIYTITCAATGSNCAKLFSAAVTLVSSALALAAENEAKSFAQDKAGEASRALAEAKALKAKLVAYFSARNISGVAGVNLNDSSGRAGGKVGSSGTNAKSTNATMSFGGGELASVEEDTQVTSTDKCVDKNNNIVPCPCDGGCASFSIDFPKTDSNIVSAVDEKLDFKMASKAITDAFNGDTKTFDAYATDKRGALAAKIKRKLMDKILLDKNISSKIPKNIKPFIERSTKPFSRKDLSSFIAENNSSMGYAAYLSRLYKGRIPAEITGREEGADVLTAKDLKVGRALSVKAVKKNIAKKLEEMDLSGLDGEKIDGIDLASIKDSYLESMRGGTLKKDEVLDLPGEQEVTQDRSEDLFDIVSKRYMRLYLKRRFHRKVVK
jgi:hypothetical protein